MLTQNIVSAIGHFFYPNHCEGCGVDVLLENAMLCSKCLYDLPKTNYMNLNENPIEKIFYGRIPIKTATSILYFTKHSIIQHLISELKYKNNKAVGIYLGNLLGIELSKSPQYETIDAIIALPLNEKKAFKRGYNQAQVICEGIIETWEKPLINNALIRVQNTATQTHENRINRWQHMQEVFKVVEPALLENKHILLVDDIITTGATLEACGLKMLEIKGCKVSFATVACSVLS